MKKNTSLDFITMLSSVINDMTYPLFDYKNDVELNNSSQMRAVKNTVSYSFGHKSGSSLAFDLKFAIQKEVPDDLKSEIKLRFEELVANFESRFNVNRLKLDIFLADKIALRVSLHPSGRYNLECCANNRCSYTQLFGAFIDNSNCRKFYESSFRLYHFLKKAGYDVEFSNINRLEGLYSVLVELDIDTRFSLYSWINRLHPKNQDKKILASVDKKILAAIEKMGLEYQPYLFGDFVMNSIPMSLYAEGVLIPEVYFTEQSLLGRQLQLYR